MECSFGGDKAAFTIDGRDYLRDAQKIIIRFKPNDLPLFRLVFKPRILRVDEADFLTGEEMLPKAALVLEATTEDYTIHVKGGLPDKQIMLIDHNDESSLIIGGFDVLDLVERMDVAIVPGHMHVTFNVVFNART